MKGALIDKVLYGDTTAITYVTDLPDNIPLQFELYPNYPNPFNPSTNIKFSLPLLSNVKIIVYNSIGEEVITLFNEPILAGAYNVVWNGIDRYNNTVPSGVYFITMLAISDIPGETNSYQKTIKTIFLK